MFSKFIEMEMGLETFSEHASHANHVLQEFLFGYNIILNCSYIKEQYDFESGRQNNESNIESYLLNDIKKILSANIESSGITGRFYKTSF